MSNLIFPALPGTHINLTRSQVWKSQVQEAVSGKEYRSTWWSTPRTRYKLQMEFARSASGYAEFQQLNQFLAAHRGKYDAFLYRDPEDSIASGAAFGVGNGSTTAFPLQRTLGATMTDKLGTWPVYQIPRTNFCPQSTTFGSWTSVGGTGVTASQITPDGLQNGCALVEDTSTGSHGKTIALTELSAFANAPVTVSVYLQPFARTQGFVRFTDKAGAGHYVFFGLSGAGTIASQSAVTNAQIVQVPGTTWYRCSFDTNTGTGAGTCTLEINGAVSVSLSYTGGGTFSLVAAYAQVEATQSFNAPNGSATLGTVPSRPITTTTGAVQDTPGYLVTGTGTGTSGRADGFEQLFDVDGTLNIRLNGVSQSPNTWSLANGIVTFTTPPAGSVVCTFDGLYWRRVRFDMDELAFDRFASQYYEVKTISLITVK